MHAIAVATISFGLVDLPVRVYAAVESKAEISFKLLHAACNSRLRRKKYACKTCKKDVGRADTIKGYEFAKNRYVTFSADELKLLEQVEEPVNQRIVISEFVNSDHRLRLANIERCSYLGPDTGSDAAYATLVCAMQRSHRAAIATYTARGRTHLVRIHNNIERLEMVQLRYAHEVRAITDIPIEYVEPAADLIMLAEQLITRLTRPEFKIEEYVDEQQLRLQEQIQQKIDGQEIAAAPTEERPEPIVDLVDALRASLKAPARKPRRRSAADSS